MKDAAHGFVSAELLARFRERIAASLAERSIDLDVEAHRHRIGQLLGGLGEASFFDLLGVGPMAEESEVHRAYTQVARVVHPGHARALAMEGREPVLELLFERVTEAYLTLSDPELRARHYRELEAAGRQPSAVGGAGRAAEKLREARRQFQIADHLATDGQYHDAIQLLEQIVRLDARGEYFALLARCLARNPLWTQEAINRYLEAVRLEPQVAEYRRELGLLFERAGNRARARQHLEGAVELDPTDAAAAEALARLGEGGGRSRVRASWWARLVHRIAARAQRDGDADP